MAERVKMTLSAGERSWAFTRETVSIGRAPFNDLVLDDPHISGMHGRLFCRDGAVFYQDLGSTNGSMVQRVGAASTIGLEMLSEIEIASGDNLLLGDRKSPILLAVRLEPAGDGQPEPDERPLDATIVASCSVREITPLAEGLVSAGGTVAGILGFMVDVSADADLGAVLERTAAFLLGACPGSQFFNVELREDNAWKPVFSKTAEGFEPQPAVSRTLTKKMLRESSAFILKDLRAEAPESRSIVSSNMRSAIIAPLAARSEILGVLQLGSAAPECPYGKVHLDLAGLAGRQIGGLIERLCLLDRLRAAERKLEEENRYLRRKAREPEAGGPLLIGQSVAMRMIREQIDLVGPAEMTVLISGETGTGKEVVARAIHHASRRRDRIFAAVNCGAFVENLLESELFGHVRGAFTGAVRDKKGLFSVADGGTLFLDEIGELPISLQVKLLRVLQDGEFMPIGATSTMRADARIIAATNRDLAKSVSDGGFREDLFYRINVFHIHIPPLRERPEDIPLLAEHFLRQISARIGRPESRLSNDSLSLLAGYGFPGNARELQNELERALLFTPQGAEISADRFTDRIKGAGPSFPHIPSGVPAKLKDAVLEFEARLIRSALDRSEGNRSRAARQLGISRQAMMLKMLRHGIK